MCLRLLAPSPGRSPRSPAALCPHAGRRRRRSQWSSSWWARRAAPWSRQSFRYRPRQPQPFHRSLLMRGLNASSGIRGLRIGFFFSVSCQCCRWCEARCPHRGHPLQRDEHGSLPGCTDTVYSFALANAVELFLVKVIKGFQPGPQDLKCLTVYLVCNTGVEVNNCNRFHYLLIFFLRDKPFNTNQKI